MPEKKNESGSAIDRQDIMFAVLLGVAAVTVKLAGRGLPGWDVTRTTTDILLSTITVAYITARARRTPEKLDAWGLSTPLTPAAWLVFVLLLGLSVVSLAACGTLISGSVAFIPAHPAQMIEYIPAAFPQQFVLCSILLASLATLPAFRGQWRLPLFVGVLFSIAHFWTPARIPGTIVPVQMLITLPAGAGAAWYFLCFRSILPLTAIHAVFYPLMHYWIERQL